MLGVDGTLPCVGVERSRGAGVAAHCLCWDVEGGRGRGGGGKIGDASEWASHFGWQTFYSGLFGFKRHPFPPPFCPLSLSFVLFRAPTLLSLLVDYYSDGRGRGRRNFDNRKSA